MNNVFLHYFETTDTSFFIQDALVETNYLTLVGYYNSSGNMVAHISVGPRLAVEGQYDVFYSTASAETPTSYSITIDTVPSMSISTSTGSSASSFTEDSSGARVGHATSLISDVSYWLDSHASSVNEQTNSTISIDFTCSVSGNTTITYSLSQYQNETVPTWVTIDEANLLLNVETPDVTANTTYNFYVNSTFNSLSYQKLISITVLYVEDTTNSTHNSTTTDTSTTSSTFVQNNEVSEDVKASRSVSQAMIGIGMSAGVLASIAGTSSPQSFWGLMNQFQMVLLLNLIGANLPKDVKDYLEGMEFTMFSLDFLSFSGIPGIMDIYDYFS